jgi:hypothetical protein
MYVALLIRQFQSCKADVFTKTVWFGMILSILMFVNDTLWSRKPDWLFSSFALALWFLIYFGLLRLMRWLLVLQVVGAFLALALLPFQIHHWETGFYMKHLALGTLQSINSLYSLFLGYICARKFMELRRQRVESELTQAPPILIPQ